MLKFDPKKHKYTDDQGREYISVTTLLGEEFPFHAKEVAAKLIKLEGHKYYKWTIKEVLKEWRDSAGFGNKVHNTVEKYIKNKTLPKDKTLIPLVEQFDKLKFTGTIISECKVWDEDLLIAGTADIIEDCGSCLYLYDIKTSAKVGDDKLMKFSMQLEIYKRLIEKRFNKPCKVVGIIWFEDYVEQREKTKLRVLKPLNCEEMVNTLLEKRKLQINS